MLLNIGCINVNRLNSNKFQIVLSVVIILTSVFNLICAPFVVYELDDWSKAMSTSLTMLQTRVVAITSFISRGIILYNIKYNKYKKYKTTLESFDIYSPMTDIALNQCKLFSIVVYCLSLIIIVPINVIKLKNLFTYHPDGIRVSTYFLFFYVQNLSMCFVENHFTNECFMVFKKFREVNDKLKNIKSEYSDVKRFSFLRDMINSPSSIVYDKDFYCPNDKKHPLTNAIEVIKIRHWLSREAVTELNYLYDHHLGLSLISLSIQIVFNIYTFAFHTDHSTDIHLERSIFRTKFLFFFWMLQYTIRFCAITIASNVVTKQVT